MERKRKLPARAAARAEHASKKRTMTPPERSATPVSIAEPEPAPIEEPPPPPLPKSIQPGKPLPTVEIAQPEDLASKDYQSIQESGVLGESLSRSRANWIREGIFEKYWTKPTKKKGAIKEDNPAKDTMLKLGPVTITVEPHVFEATMYAVKDPKPPQPAPTTQATFRPILQYGPPKGVMPPPPTPTLTASSTASTPAPNPPPKLATQSASAPAQSTAKSTTQTPNSTAPQAAPKPAAATGSAPTPVPQSATQTQPSPAPPSAAAPKPVASPRGMESVLSPTAAAPQVAQRPAVQPTPSPASSGTVTPSASLGKPYGSNTTQSTHGKPSNGAPAAKHGVADPIIIMLAEKAGEDAELRDLMKRVASGDAAKHELEKFQSVIDAITAESKRKGGPVAPSADRLLVDGRTVRYFANEVSAILDIVLSSNPKQTSVDLRPPPGSDPLVVMLVNTALDDVKVKHMIQRIAVDKPSHTDAVDLKDLLDRLFKKLRQAAPSPAPAPTPKTNGVANGHASSSAQAVQHQPAPPQQALRSKGPPPAPKLDISAIVFEFTGGNGDRYLFPKFSILEYDRNSGPGTQVIASFLIVLKGSNSDYPPVDDAVDYYQPVTIRLSSTISNILENLARVVAPGDEVRRYMDDVMDKMTRAEYILLALRLPRNENANMDASMVEELDKESQKDKDKENDVQAITNGPANKQGALTFVNSTPQPPKVLWTTSTMAKPLKAEIRELPPRSRVYNKKETDDEYQNFIASVSQKKKAEEA